MVSVQNFSMFLRSPFPFDEGIDAGCFVGVQNHDAWDRRRHASTPIELWTLKAKSHLARAEAMPDANSHFVQYEDILRDPATVIAWLGRRLCLQWETSTCGGLSLLQPQSSTKLNELSRFGLRSRNPRHTNLAKRFAYKIPTSNPPIRGDKFTFQNYRDFYLGSGLRDAMSPRDLGFIDSQLDSSVMLNLGYSRHSDNPKHAVS